MSTEEQNKSQQQLKSQKESVRSQWQYDATAEPLREAADAMQPRAIKINIILI
jgi:hypothetical protein